MHRINAIILLCCVAISMSAQSSFVQNLGTKNALGASVNVHQSSDIDALVNGKSAPVAPAAGQTLSSSSTTAAQTATTPTTSAQKTTTTTPSINQNTPMSTNGNNATAGHEQQSVTTPATSNARSGNIQSDSSGQEFNYDDVDHSKKVMRKSYKINGYRVQVFAGGNSRNDRQKAEQIGNNIKNLFPTEPVYTHFYSPRWICRMGNYRTYEEARAMLLKVKAAGYKEAVIVKGKISVAY